MLISNTRIYTIRVTAPVLQNLGRLHCKATSQPAELLLIVNNELFVVLLDVCAQFIQCKLELFDVGLELGLDSLALLVRHILDFHVALRHLITESVHDSLWLVLLNAL